MEEQKGSTTPVELFPYAHPNGHGADLLNVRVCLIGDSKSINYENSRLDRDGNLFPNQTQKP